MKRTKKVKPNGRMHVNFWFYILYRLWFNSKLCFFSNICKLLHFLGCETLFCLFVRTLDEDDTLLYMQFHFWVNEKENLRIIHFRCIYAYFWYFVTEWLQSQKNNDWGLLLSRKSYDIYYFWGLSYGWENPWRFFHEACI